MQHDDRRRWWGVILIGEDIRRQAFLRQLDGGRNLKQFCAIVEHRSTLEHTLTRVERLIPRERLLVVVSQHNGDEALRQLIHWPAHNVIQQPVNRDTAPGVLLPLTHIAHRDPFATVAIFPSDQLVQEEECFMSCVQQAMEETQRYPRELTLLGVTPDRVEGEEEYGWIEPGSVEFGRETRPVRRFWEKPTANEAYSLLRRNAVWNTFVFTAQAATLWEMTRQTVPDLYEDFMHIRRALPKPHCATVVESVYQTMPAVNFSSVIYQSLAGRLRVLRTPAVGWGKWGSQDRLLKSSRQLGELDEQGESLWNRRTMVARSQESHSPLRRA